MEWNLVKSEITTHCDLTYKVGYYGFGYQTNYDLDFRIEQEASFNDFNTITDDDEITLLIKPEDLSGSIDFKRYRFYAFPFVFGHKVFYVSSCKTNINPNDSDKIVSYEVVFTNISNKLQKSGQSIEQYFHHNIAGNGYAWPLLDKENKRVMLDVDKLNTIGVNIIQEETYNACLQNNTAFIGWEVVDYDEIEKRKDGFVGDITNIKDNGDGTYTQRFYAPKLIFPCNFRSAEPTILTKKALPESDLAIISKVNFSEDNYEEWKKYWESYFSGDFSVKYSGEMEWGFRKDIYSYQKLNDTIDGLRLVFKGVASGFCKNDIDTNGTALNWADANFYNYLTNKDVFTLPFSFTNHILNQPKQWSIIGGIWDNITNGFPWGWDEQNRIINNNRDMCFLTSSTMLDISKKDWNTSSGQQNDKAFINTWYAKDSDDRFNANNRTLAVKYNLTSTIELKENLHNNKLYETSILGQTMYWFNQKAGDVKQFFPVYETTKEPFLIDGTQKLYTNINFNRFGNYKGRTFVICGISNQNCFGDSQKFTMFNGYKPLWTNTFITNSTFRNTSRDWTNLYFTNFLNNLMVIGDKIEYPTSANKNGDIEGHIVFNANENIYNILTIKNFNKFMGPYSNATIGSSVMELPYTHIDFNYINGEFNWETTKSFSRTQHYYFDINKYDTKDKLMKYLSDRIGRVGINFLFRNTLKAPYSYNYQVEYSIKVGMGANREFIDALQLMWKNDGIVYDDFIEFNDYYWLGGDRVNSKLFNEDRLPFYNVGKYQEGTFNSWNNLMGAEQAPQETNEKFRIYFDNLNLLTGEVDLRFEFYNFHLRHSFTFQALPFSSEDEVFTNAKMGNLAYKNDYVGKLSNSALAPTSVNIITSNYLILDLISFEIL